MGSRISEAAREAASQSSSVTPAGLSTVSVSVARGPFFHSTWQSSSPSAAMRVRRRSWVTSSNGSAAWFMVPFRASPEPFWGKKKRACAPFQAP